MRDYAAVAAGGAAGSLARHGVSSAMLDAFGAGFPWGTLAVNVAGSFLIGLIAALTAPGARLAAGPVARFLLMAGFCGGFTTFSAFGLDTVLLLRNGSAGTAFAYVAVSVPLWLAAVASGWRLAAITRDNQSSH